jgi:2-oxo-4-hydroxy-4-carboxy-5-ureidoimidazoline decarboxylase
VHWRTRAPEDILEALSGHPMIGDINTLRAKYANTKAMAKGEQSGMDSASYDVLEALQSLNHAYLDKHGFIFIICASGLSAKAMLEAIEKRIENTTEQEFATATDEQLKITHLRIDKGLKNDA